MRRTPDARWLATRHRRTFILDHLPATGTGNQPRLGTHLQARIQSVRADLGTAATGSDQWQESQAAFTEYEALHARLNYRHAELRHTTPKPSAHDFRQLQQDFRTLGAYGDAARVALIPGSETAFTIHETLYGFGALDITACRVHCRPGIPSKTAPDPCPSAQPTAPYPGDSSPATNR